MYPGVVVTSWANSAVKDTGARRKCKSHSERHGIARLRDLGGGECSSGVVTQISLHFCTRWGRAAVMSDMLFTIFQDGS